MLGMRPLWRNDKDFTQLLSHHLPLHRTLAALLQAALQRQDASTIAHLALTVEQAGRLAEHPLRLQLRRRCHRPRRSRLRAVAMFR